MPLSDLPSNCQAGGVLCSFFLPSSVSHYCHFIFIAQHITSITRQSGHIMAKKANSLKHWNLLPWNSGVRLTQVHRRADFWFQPVWSSDAPPGRLSAAAGSDGCERDLSAGTKQIFSLRIGKKYIMKTTWAS